MLPDGHGHSLSMSQVGHELQPTTAPTAADAEDKPQTHVNDLPEEAMMIVLKPLSARHLASAQCVQRSWRRLGQNPVLWEALCTSRWKRWKPCRWDKSCNLGQWKEVYSRRHQLDSEAGIALRDMPCPLKRHKSLEAIAECGEDVLEHLEEETKRTGPLTVGSRYWATLANEYLTANVAAHELSLLRGLENPDVPLEKGAMVLARVFAPGDDPSWVPGFLDSLAEEFRRRVASEGFSLSTNRIRGVTLLNQMMFGAAEPTNLPHEDEEGQQRIPKVPTAGYGLGLAGNRDNYYDPRNSFIHQVLMRRMGIPITLAVLQCSVGLRCGLPLQAVGMPCHLLTKLGTTSDADEVFIDCFDEGRIMSRPETYSLMSSIGIPQKPSLLDPMKGHEVHLRMAANLVHVYRQSRELRRLWQVLEMLRTFHPTPDYLLMHAQLALFKMGDAAGAFMSLERLQIGSTPGTRTLMPVLEQLRQEAFRRQHDLQEASKNPSRRSPEGPRYRVGDLIKHERYGYRGVICGWHLSCKASQEWIERMKVRDLPGGLDQPFYNVMVDTRDRETQTCYVAEENIRLLVHLRQPPKAEDQSIDEEASWEIEHPDIGEHFEGLSMTSQGKPWPHYVANSYLRAHYPDEEEGRPNQEPRRH